MPKKKKENDQNAMVSGRMHGELQIKGRLWVESAGRTYLSWGRVELLERIAEFGSVSAAAKSMEMSFSHAWHLVEDMNTLAPQPLVEKQTGGRQGGGAWLTDAGREAITGFRQMVERFQNWVEKEEP